MNKNDTIRLLHLRGGDWLALRFRRDGTFNAPIGTAADRGTLQRRIESNFYPDAMGARIDFINSDTD